MTTTSRLSTHAFELTPNDLQVLADYALEAPHEWRLVLERVIEIAQAEHDYKDLEAELHDLRDEYQELKNDLKNARASFANKFRAYRLLLDKMLGDGPSQLRDQFLVTEEHVLDKVDELLEPKSDSDEEKK